MQFSDSQGAMLKDHHTGKMVAYSNFSLCATGWMSHVKRKHPHVEHKKICLLPCRKGRGGGERGEPRGYKADMYALQSPKSNSHSSFPRNWGNAMAACVLIDRLSSRRLNPFNLLCHFHDHGIHNLEEVLNQSNVPCHFQNDRIDNFVSMPAQPHSLYHGNEDWNPRKWGERKSAPNLCTLSPPELFCSHPQNYSEVTPRIILHCHYQMILHQEQDGKWCEPFCCFTNCHFG